MSVAEIVEYPRYSVPQTAQLLCDMAKQHSRAVVIFHARPDGDAVGSAFALRTLLECMGLQVRCLCADRVPARLRFVTDGIQDDVRAEALETEFWSEDVLAISVDTASPAQMGSLAECWQSRVALMIDHHGTGTPYAPGCILPEAAATGELIYAIAQQWLRMGVIDDIPFSAATAMYTAISADTGSFRYSNTTEQTFLCAAALRSRGVDTAAISHALFENKSLAQLKAEHLGFSAMQLWEGGRVALIPFTYEMKAEHGISDEQLETLVDVARQIEGVEIAMAVRQPAQEGRFRVSTRSSGAFNVAALCARLGGGGHVKAAGCTVMAENMDEALAVLYRALQQELLLQKS